MNPALEDFLAKYVDLTPSEKEHVVSRFKKKTLRKHEYLLRAGQVCKDLVFVREGCLRLFHIVNDIEVSVWFSFKNSSAIEISSFLSAQPGNYFIEAIEESEVFMLPKAELIKLYKSEPKMQEWMRLFLEDVILNLIERFTSLQKDSAEFRYKQLLLKPGYLQQVPQKYLASFIGITPTSLSRLRRKIR